MRILYVTLGGPYPLITGANIRSYNVIRQAARQHTVLLLSLLYPGQDPRDLDPMHELCEYVDAVAPRLRPWREYIRQAPRHLLARWPLATSEYYDDRMAGKIRETVARERVDLVQIEHSFMARYLDALPADGSVKSILSFHNLGSRQYRRMLDLRLDPRRRAGYLVKWLLMLRWEARVAERFDGVIAVSEDEASLLRRANPRLRVSVVENGVDTRAYQPLPDDASTNTLLFVGTFGYPPNVDAVDYFCRVILPLVRRQVPDARFVAVGHEAPAELRQLADQGAFTLLTEVSDVRPLYRQAKATVVPLRAGGGTRLKILESLALGRPVVSTSIGVEGLAAVDREHLLVADDPARFAEAVVRLLREPALRRRLSRSGRLLVESRYDWSVVGRQLEHAYRVLVFDTAAQP